MRKKSSPLVIGPCGVRSLEKDLPAFHTALPLGCNESGKGLAGSRSIGVCYCYEIRKLFVTCNCGHGNSESNLFR